MNLAESGDNPFPIPLKDIAIALGKTGTDDARYIFNNTIKKNSDFLEGIAYINRVQSTRFNKGGRDIFNRHISNNPKFVDNIDYFTTRNVARRENKEDFVDNIDYLVSLTVERNPEGGRGSEKYISKFSCSGVDIHIRYENRAP